MTKLVKDIEAINGEVTQLQKGIEHEQEHKETLSKLIDAVCKACGGSIDAETKDKLLLEAYQDTANDHIVKGHYPLYYDYLEEMEEKMNYEAVR